MALYTVYSHGVVYKYKTSLCSKATCILIIVSILTFLFPFFLSYNSNGFWLKTDTYKEQPDVHFKYDYLLILETDSLTLPIFCGTYPMLNRISNKIGHCSMMKVIESDNNRDGLHDSLYFEIEVKLPGSVKVKIVTLLLFFDYKISDYCWLQMEGLGLIQYNSPLSGIQLNYVADLIMVQRHPFNPRLRNQAYNYSTLKKDDQTLHLPSLLSAYSARNVNTRLDNIYSTWMSGRTEGDPFLVKTTIFYPETTITYKPTFWQVIKFGWIQYFSVLVISIYVFNSFKKFIFCNRLVHTFKENPSKK